MAIKTYLTPAEIQQMKEKAPTLRDKVIVSFYSDTGARASELLRLKKKDLDLDNNIVLIPHLKRGIRKKCPRCGKAAGRKTPFCSRCGADLAKVIPEGVEEKTRLINIAPETAMLMREYTAEMSSDDPVINLSRQQVYNIVRSAARAIGLEGKVILNPMTRKRHYVHPHSFRDSLAVDWLEAVGDNATKQKALQDHLGHSKFDTTMRYAKLTPKKVKDVSEEVRQMRFGG